MLQHYTSIINTIFNRSFITQGHMLQRARACGGWSREKDRLRAETEVRLPEQIFRRFVLVTELKLMYG